MLVIDDDVQVQNMLAQMLGQLRLGVLTASDGIDGVAQARTQSPDLVIADIYMPDGDGISTILAIREFDPSVPIVALSGGGRMKSFDLLEASAAAGANRTMRKPVDLEELLDVVHELLPSWR
ncbi:MAG: response regulator [bacterium]